MDLKVVVYDENNNILGRVLIYQDGSDSEGTDLICQLLTAEFSTERTYPKSHECCDECSEMKTDPDEEECFNCGHVHEHFLPGEGEDDSE